MLLTAFSALFSFLGGSAFRMIWGEVSNWYSQKQDHSFELDRMRLQAELADKDHARTMEALRLQADLKLHVIEAQSVADVDLEEAKAFTVAQMGAFQRTGIMFVDAWNAIIRPAIATVAMILWISKLWHQSGSMDAWDMDLCGAVFGFFFADRSLLKRGK